MKGRDKCELLNEIRQNIARENGIDFVIYECTFEGDCSGTCPKCEAELKYLEAELARKQARGEKINLNGIFTLEPGEPTCDLQNEIMDLEGIPPLNEDEHYLGDIPLPDEKPHIEEETIKGIPAEGDYIHKMKKPPEK